MHLHGPLKTPHLVLKLAARPIEGVVDREQRLVVTLVGIGRAVDVDMASVREGKMDPDLEMPPVRWRWLGGLITTRPETILPNLRSRSSSRSSTCARSASLPSVP